MALPKTTGLDFSGDGSTFCRIDLSRRSGDLDISSDGSPWLGFISTPPPLEDFSGGFDPMSGGYS